MLTLKPEINMEKSDIRKILKIIEDKLVKKIVLTESEVDILKREIYLLRKNI